MLTKGDLQAIVEVINPLIEIEGEKTRKELKEYVKDYVQANNSILGQIVRIELAEQKKEIITVMKAGFREVGTIIRELKTSQNEQLEQAKERVSKLEKQRSPIRN